MNSTAVAAIKRTAAPGHRGLAAWGVALVVLAGLWYAGPKLAWLSAWPDEWIVPLRYWISDLMRWLVKDATFGLFTVKEFMRGIAWVLGLPLQACIHLLVEGVRIPLPGDTVLQLPSLPWFGVLLALTFGAWRLGGRSLALLVFIGFGYLAVFGQWASAMVTLSSILVGVPVGVVLGATLGILGYRSERFVRVLTPVLDLMQTVPVFAYLIPVLFLFGFGPVSAMIATIIYATPPMVRVTMLSLRSIPPEIVEYGRMAGCTPRQMLWKVLLPSARGSLMVGVNQVIMLSLNMVIIASMIGAGGLGHDVLRSLQRLAIGDGLEAGVAITVLAVVLDRLSQAFANRTAVPEHVKAARGFVGRHATALGITVIVLVTYVAGFLVPGLHEYPRALVLDTSAFWDELVRWINVNLFVYIDAVKSWLLINMLVPFKRFLLEAPWVGVTLLLGVAGWRAAGWRLGLVLIAFATFIAVTGNWEKAIVSVYICGIAVIVASLIGIPIGIWAASNDRVHAIAQNVADTLQTLPSFVYLIPVVMLFQVGEFSAMIAVTAYAVAPAIRYTDHGIRRVPGEVVEAALMSGCRPWQILVKVRLPLALPEIMLGVNQTIMMALSMLVITALVGTRDLGQEVYIALTQSDTGHGLVAGLCVAFIAMTADRLISAWSSRRKRELGLD